MFTKTATAEAAQGREVLRITLTIALCMLAGQLFNFESAVYLALFSTIVMTKARDLSWRGLIKLFTPILISVAAAILVSQLFQGHPFIIWSISLVFFDQLRKRANTPAKLGQMLMPAVNWILIIMFSQNERFNMTTRFEEIVLAMLVTGVVTRLMLTCLPEAKTTSAAITAPSALTPVPAQMMQAQPVSYAHRVVSLTLIGSGLAILMITNLLSAAFCMVPVVVAATKTEPDKFGRVINDRLTTQLAGCALAALFTLTMAGHQANIGYYAMALGLLIFVMARLIVTNTGPARDIHADALLATLLPISLYMGSQTLGLENTFLRGWQLLVTLIMLLMIYRITQPRERYDNATRSIT